MNAEWTAIVTAAGTLLGAGLGGVLVNFGGKRQFERQRKWQRDQFLQERLEDIARIAEEIDDISKSLYGNALLLVETQKPLPPGRTIPLARLKALIEFYAPELRPHGARIVEIRDKVGEYIADAISNRSRTKEERQQINLQFMRGMLEMTTACETLSTAAAELGRKRLGLADQ
jgi:hypothetical protein